jgi:GrpB-like predicted nucleotidyltransferase (UPF0157 family)
VRRKLLFRGFLRANEEARDAWGDFKRRLASMASDPCEYGQAKAGPTQILMIAAGAGHRAPGGHLPSAGP